MTSYTDYIKKARADAEVKFFGPTEHRSAKYFCFSHVLSQDECILVTRNIVRIKGNPVLVVGTNSGVYLKDWTMREVHSHEDGYNAYAVKLKRDFFKIYAFAQPLSDDIDMEIHSFDDLLKIASSQDGSYIALGHAEVDYI